LRGELVVMFSSNRPERVEAGATLFSDLGELRVHAARPFGNRFLVTFEGVDTLEAAERLRGAVLRARPLVDGDALWVHELVGSEVVRVGDGVPVGTVASVIANPASDILELDTGALVPLRFVVGRSEGRVEVDVPAGLLD